MVINSCVLDDRFAGIRKLQAKLTKVSPTQLVAHPFHVSSRLARFSSVFPVAPLLNCSGVRYRIRLNRRFNLLRAAFGLFPTTACTQR